MKTDTIITTTEPAKRDQECFICGFMVRAGSRVYRREDGRIYGSVKCLRSHAVTVAIGAKEDRKEHQK